VESKGSSDEGRSPGLPVGLVVAVEAIVVAIIPDFVRREVSALWSTGCQQVTIDHFDRDNSIWSITFEKDSKRRARLLWCMEVDA
jgi:hypothetical protein